jgi:hypothetical protein
LPPVTSTPPSASAAARPGWPGPTADPYRVWLEDWSVEEIAPGQVRLRAQTADAALDLVLTETLPPVLHGDGGLSQKGPEPGNASYYYSIIQQQAAGTVPSAGRVRRDRSGLERPRVEHQRPERRCYRLGLVLAANGRRRGADAVRDSPRRRHARAATSAGTYVAPDGTLTHLAAGDWTLEVTDTWVSPTSGGEYPAGWRISVPSVGLELDRAAADGQPGTQRLDGLLGRGGGVQRHAARRAGLMPNGVHRVDGVRGSMEGRL